MIARRATLAGFALALSGVSGCSKPDLSFIGQVQDAVMAACSFVPLIATILAILNLHDSALQTVQQIADAICKALVSAERSRQRGISMVPEVKGVPIMGRYIQTWR